MYKNLWINIWSWCFILASVLMHTEAQAVDTMRTGTGRLKIASGIVVTSVLTTAGALAILSFGMGLCGEYTYDSCPSDYLLGGTAAMGVGLGLGIPLIVSGARDRKAWKTQNRTELSEPDSESSPIGINLFVTRTKSSMLSFTYDL
jgi:hypothetical protein